MLHTADSRRNVTRWICSECGSWICSGAKPGSANPNAFRNVRAGTLDDTSWLCPATHFWTRNKQPWIVLPDEPSPVFETQPDDIFAFFQLGGGQCTLSGRPTGSRGLNPDRTIGW